MEAYLTRKEVSEILKVTSETIRKLEKKGLILPVIIVNGRPRYNHDFLEVLKKNGGLANGNTPD